MRKRPLRIRVTWTKTRWAKHVIAIQKNVLPAIRTDALQQREVNTSAFRVLLENDTTYLFSLPADDASHNQRKTARRNLLRLPLTSRYFPLLAISNLPSQSVHFLAFQ